MRYHVTGTRFSSAPEASTRQVAETLYDEAVERSEPGDTIQLIDTKKDNKILMSFHHDTPAELVAQRDRALDRYVAAELDQRETLLEFAKKIVAEVDTDPTYQLRWADDAFAAAARRTVALVVLSLREQKQSWPEIAEYIRSEMMRAARHPSRSSSPCANLNAQCVLAAQAEMVGAIERTFKWTAK